MIYNPCTYCGTKRHAGSKEFCSHDHTNTCSFILYQKTECNCNGPQINKMPEGQGKRDKERLRYDYVPIEFDNELASIFKEGRRPRSGMPEGYGDSWKAGGETFLCDCLNHAFWHLKMYQSGDRSENHLAKVAWNVLAVRWHEQRNSETPYDIKGD